MDILMPASSRRHNPVDSICRKLQTIQWRGEREPNSPFQIPKLSSSSYNSPQSGLRHNLAAILKMRNGHTEEDDDDDDDDDDDEEEEQEQRETFCRPSMVPSTDSQRNYLATLSDLPSFTTPAPNPPSPANVTYTVNSILGDRRGRVSGGVQGRTWQRYCSTPAAQNSSSRGGQITGQPSGVVTRPLRGAYAQSQGCLSYNLNFTSTDTGGSLDSELPYPALVVKRLSLGIGGSVLANDSRKETTEVSLICEEDLLDTIFHACDTQRRGKVYVSRIVDYLRHTTSRGSEDSGLEELCNMLDPENKDVSIDLDTYHAVMKEWIDDCRNNGEELAEDHTLDSVKLPDGLAAKRSMLFNMTSGSLEALGGEASRLDLETSELVYCVADLQLSNQRLQEEVKTLKQSMEGMEESNLKLAEENEDLRCQARISQQLSQKEKLLKDEVEEMKATLSCTEEGRARASAHLKNTERENQSLIAKISALQEENFKSSMEMDERERKMRELRDVNAELQVQIHSFDSLFTEQENRLIQKSRHIEELKAAVEEYSSFTELLRADKTKLESHLQMMHPGVAGSLSVAYRLNQTSSGSLQTELALAQSPLEEAEHLSFGGTVSLASPLDETLDREVLLMLRQQQGPCPEQMALEFRSLLEKLKKDIGEEAASILSTVQGLVEDPRQLQADRRAVFQAVQAELDSRRAHWVKDLELLAQYTDSLERELIKMAGNMRRSRTDILHLSVRVQEQENRRRKLCDELEQLRTPQASREASSQMPEPEPGHDLLDVDVLSGDGELAWDEEFVLRDLLRSELAERSHGEQECRADGSPLESPGRGERRRMGGEEEERWTVVDLGAQKREPRDASTPFEDPSGEARPVQGEDSTADPDAELQVSCHTSQEEVELLPNTHTQAARVGQPAALSFSEPSYSRERRDAEILLSVTTQNQNEAPEQRTTVVPDHMPLRQAEMVAPNRKDPGKDETITLNGSPRPIGDYTIDAGADPDPATDDMSLVKSLSQEQLPAEHSASLLPVLVEEEEGVQEPAGTPNVVVNMAGTNGHTTTGLTVPRGNSPAQRVSPSLERSRTTTYPASEDLSEAGMASDKEETCLVSGIDRDKTSLSPSDKEIETEFQRLSLGFKCDMFTLEKRLRLEERSRDLAEENVRKEISSCQGLLQALIPLCEDDNQAMEIIQRLKKNLEILVQSMTRVSGRSEMLGAIHQESRIGKAVEVMIQHVENLKRTYTKEHTELLELRETLVQSERSFGSQTEKDDFRGKKQQSGGSYYKASARRVSIAAIPRSGGSSMQFDRTKTQDPSEAENDRLTRRSPWTVAGKSSGRPPLKRFVSSGAWVDVEESSLMMQGTSHNAAMDPPSSEEEERPEPSQERRKSSLSELGCKLTSLILSPIIPSPSSSPTGADPAAGPCLSQNAATALSPSQATVVVARGNRGPWLWLAMLVVLAGLLALLASLVMQPAADAAHVGTGSSWTTIQQLLWPYAGLRHNGQPPV